MRTVKYILFSGLVFIAGCERTPIINADIIGMWRGADGAELHFEPNGKFSGSNLLRSYVIWPDKKGKIESGSGSWSIKFQASPLHGEPELELIFESSKDFPGGFLTPLYVSGEGSGLTLYFWSEGEPNYEFMKVPPPL